jgi:hypothetical protein
MPENHSLAGPALALRLEQACRWRQGDRAPAEEYLARHPEMGTDPEYALEVIFGELLLREEEGERPGAEEFVRRFPQFADQVRRLFEVHTAVRSACLRESADAGTRPQEISATETPIAFPGPATERGPLGQLGPYHVMEMLGQGGMGFVYKAYDERFARIVAIKFLKPGLGEVERARFEREARAAGAVNDDHVVVVHDVGAAPDCDLRYIVMEYVEGETAANRLRRGRALPPHEAAELVRQVAAGLAAAHARGLVHRDVKPSNILLERGTGRAKIADFGLARSLDASGERLTLSGAILGTPHYMSPEHIRRPAATDARGDVYGLGAVLYEMLTGTPPFCGTTYAILQQILHDEPRPPRKLDDRIPRDLETICLKAMAKEPGRRYQTATEMAEDLRRWLAGESIRARPVGPLGRAWRWCRRPERIRDVGGLTLAVALVFGLWTALGVLALLTGLIPSERPLGSLLLVGLDAVAFFTFALVGRYAIAKRLAALWAGLVAGLLSLALVVALLLGMPFDGGGWLKDPLMRAAILSLFALLATTVVIGYIMALGAHYTNRKREC